MEMKMRKAMKGYLMVPMDGEEIQILNPYYTRGKLQGQKEPEFS